jgi:hypothetical protein
MMWWIAKYILFSIFSAYPATATAKGSAHLSGF